MTPQPPRKPDILVIDIPLQVPAGANVTITPLYVREASPDGGLTWGEMVITPAAANDMVMALGNRARRRVLAAQLRRKKR